MYNNIDIHMCIGQEKWMEEEKEKNKMKMKK